MAVELGDMIKTADNCAGINSREIVSVLDCGCRDGEEVRNYVARRAAPLFLAM